MKNKRTEIIFSETVTEIMGNPPSKIVRTGTGIIFFIFILFILFACIIRYPDVIPSPIVITTTNPPITLVSKITGHIQYLYVHDKDSVRSGELMAIMETGADAGEISTLKILLDSLKPGPSTILPELSRLGELQENYSAFAKSLDDLQNFDRNDFYGSKVTSMTREITGLKQYIERLKVKEKLLSENRKLEWRKFNRDSGLFVSNVLSQSQYESARQLLLKNDMDLQDLHLSLAGKMVEIEEKEQQLQDYRIKKTEDRQRLSGALNESFLNLKAKLLLWENTYFLISPVDGITTFTKYWSINQSVMKDEPVLSVIPGQPGRFIGRINLKMQRSGKVRENQIVNIKLSGFPYLEYGMLRGVVRSKSLVPSGDAYIIDVDLPQGLKTLYGNSIEFSQNMQGIAEIITDDISLIQKIVNPVRHMLANNRRKNYRPE